MNRAFLIKNKINFYKANNSFGKRLRYSDN